MSTNTLARSRPIVYPESDGKPIGESDVHRDETLALIAALQAYYRNEPLLYVSGDLMFYYEEGNPKKVVSPDVFVVKGIEQRQRRVYKLWEERALPCLAIEISSRSTRREDLGVKKQLYAALGIAEYVLFDPLEEYLQPSLQGFRLEQGGYAPIRVENDGGLHLNSLGLHLRREGYALALYDAASGAKLLRPLEMDLARRQAEEQKRTAEEQKRTAEEQKRNAEEQFERAQEQARRAEALVQVEQQARQAAEELAARLQAELRRLRGEV
jgi:Uma2 family endonuclease